MEPPQFPLILRNILLAVFAAVFLGDSIFIVPPNVHRWEDQCYQNSKAANKGKDGNALLLGLEDTLETHTTLTNVRHNVLFLEGGFFVNSAAVTFLLFLCVPFVHCGHINTCAMWIMTIKITTMAFVWQQKPCFDNQYTADFNALEQKIPQLQRSHFMPQSRTSEVEHSPADNKLMHTKSSL